MTKQANEKYTNQQPWIEATVLRGDQTGRTIGFPSLNFDPSLWPNNLRENPGVYASLVRIAGQTHHGALYFGSRLVMGETHNVLEIYVLDFTADVYDQIVEFQIGEFIHPPHNFSSLTALKVQLSQDVIAIQAAAA